MQAKLVALVAERDLVVIAWVDEHTEPRPFVAFLEQFAQPSEIQPAIPNFVQMVAEGDLVAISTLSTEVDANGTPYATTWFDLFRVDGGLLVEHWDPATKSIGEVRATRERVSAVARRLGVSSSAAYPWMRATPAAKAPAFARVVPRRPLGWAGARANVLCAEEQGAVRVRRQARRREVLAAEASEYR